MWHLLRGQTVEARLATQVRQYSRLLGVSSLPAYLYNMCIFYFNSCFPLKSKSEVNELYTSLALSHASSSAALAARGRAARRGRPAGGPIFLRHCQCGGLSPARRCVPTPQMDEFGAKMFLTPAHQDTLNCFACLASEDGCARTQSDSENGLPANTPKKFQRRQLTTWACSSQLGGRS